MLCNKLDRLDAARLDAGQSSERVFHLLPSRSQKTQELLTAILSTITELGYEEAEVFAVRLALDEAFANAIRHGNRGDASRQIAVWYLAKPQLFWIRIQDEGPGFNPQGVPDPTLPENLDRPCGRGVMLMRHYMTTVEYHPPGNCVEMTLQR